MEFLPSEGAPNARLKSKGRDILTRVRIAWYYRPGDISDRQVSDSRLLMAAIYTEVIPITHIRGKCWVKHKEKIPDLIAWRKKPDRFYYHRLFDPFIKKELDVLPTSDIHNCEFISPNSVTLVCTIFQYHDISKMCLLLGMSML